MNIARILFPVKVLGQGKRIGIWVCGCTRKCPGCSNPELWERQQKYEISLPHLEKLIYDIVFVHEVDGFTITGGEPVEQAKELSELITFMKSLNEDILMYTGYSLEELQKNPSDDIKSILASIAVLIDGKYIEERNTGVLIRGSDNQRIRILNPRYKERYENYLKTAHNQIQNFATTDGVVSVGIHKNSFRKRIIKRIQNDERCVINDGK